MRFGLVAACLVLGIGSASAAPVTYNFTGTITQVGAISSGSSLRPPTVNDTVNISITVEQNFPGSAGKDVGTYSDNGPFYPSAPNGLITSALFQDSAANSVYNYDANNIFDSIIIDRKSNISFRSTGPQILAGFDLTLSGARGNTLNDTTLPSSLDASDFTFGTFVRRYNDIDNNRYSGVINGLYVSPGNSGNAVPEPASMAILGVSMLGMLLIRRKR